MTNEIEVVLPLIREGFTDATITKWFVKVGDKINEDTPLAEVAADKIVVEIPSPKSGIVTKLLYNQNDVVPVGSVIVLLENEYSDSVNVLQSEQRKEINTVAISKENIEEEDQTTQKQNISEKPTKRFLSPLVRLLIKEQNISESELNSVKGSGLDGRITKTDIENFISLKKHQEKEPVVKNNIIETISEPVREITQNPAVTSVFNGEIMQMNRMQKLIAENMVRSVNTSPHVTSFIEVDATSIVKWRNREKEEFLKKHGQKLTFMPVFVEATAMAIKNYPLINVSVENTQILIKKNINIGIATILQNGNLIVPVIKNADQKNLIGLTISLNDLTQRAVTGNLLPDEIKGGTFTIINLGSFGTLTGTPIINQPEVAILAVGAIHKKPSVIETSLGDAIAIRHKTILSVTYDRRVIDAALAGKFLKQIAENIEQFNILRKF